MAEQAADAISTAVPVRRRFVLGAAGYLVAAILGCAVITLSAKIQVPFWPVPQTLQTLAVFLLAMLLGRWKGSLAVFSYLAAGATGLPVFAGAAGQASGLAYMIGPTGGYLAGFLLAALILGGLADRGWARGFLPALAAMSVGLLCVYLPGLVWLADYVGTGKAIQFGLHPFLIGDVAKLLLGAAVLPYICMFRDRLG